MPMISVIVPVYNAEKLIVNCIDSILAQTFSDFELLLVDDGSTDRSGKICDKYASAHSNIRVIHQSNHGQAAARNFAVSKANGQWIAFVDADDILHPQYLELLYRAAVEQNVKLSVCDIWEDSTLPADFHSSQQLRVTFHQVSPQTMLQWMEGTCQTVSRFAYWVIWGKLIHRSIIEKFPFTENRIYEDNAVVCKWLYEAQSFAFCKNTMYFYYVNPEGTTKKPYTLKRLDWLWAVTEQIHFWEQTGYHELSFIFKKRYVWEALREYEHVTQLLNDKAAAHRLRRHIWWYLIGNQRKIRMSYSEWMEVFSRLHPALREKLSSFRRKG